MTSLEPISGTPGVPATRLADLDFDHEAGLVNASASASATASVAATALESHSNARAAITAVVPLRIALLGYRSHPHVGGQGIYIKYLSKALVELGHRVDVLSGPPYPDLDPRVQLVKIPSLDLFAANNHATALRWHHLKSYSDCFEWLSMLTGGFSEPYTFGRRAAKYLKQHGHHYDLVHDNQCLAYGLLAIEKSGLPVVATVHHPITRDFQLALAAANWRHRLLIRRWHSFLRMQGQVVRKLKHVVTVSVQSQRDIAQAFKRPAELTPIMYNGIDTDTFKPLGTIERESQLLITTSSADQPLKGLRFLLQAMAMLKASHPNLRLLVIGKLKVDGKTAKLLRRLQLNEAVEFTSGISTEALVQHYNRATIAISPSLYEGFGLPAGEAMACQTPVITSDGGALPEVVGQAGRVVNAGNSRQLASAIEELLNNPGLRDELGRSARTRILEQFCWRVKALRLSDYYHNVMLANPASQQRLAERLNSAAKPDTTAHGDIDRGGDGMLPYVDRHGDLREQVSVDDVPGVAC